MTSVVKTLRFDAAHILTNHNGLCKNLHGHTYRVDIAVSGDVTDEGMVVDFKDLKKAAEAEISPFDHSFIYNVNSPGEKTIAEAVEAQGMRTVALSFRTTAENLARYFHERLKKIFPSILYVRVWETPDNMAEYRQ